MDGLTPCVRPDKPGEAPSSPREHHSKRQHLSRAIRSRESSSKQRGHLGGGEVTTVSVSEMKKSGEHL